MASILSTYSPQQGELIINTVQEIIERLPGKALEQLLNGFFGDVDKMVREITLQTANVYSLNSTLDSRDLDYLEDVKTSMDISLKKFSYNYFKTTVLPNFHQGWRNLEWGNLIQLFPKSAFLASRSHGKTYEFSFAFPLWRVYSYDRPDFFVQEDIDNKNRKETALISNTATLGRLNIGKIVEEISCNEILSQKINPNGKATLNAESVVSETGSKIHMRGKEGFIRGLHVGAVVNDDLPDDSSIYSAEQREKLLNIFKGAINPIVEPYGFNLVSGTPYQERDLYYELKKPESGFAVFEYPAIFPDGRLLSPDRFTFEKLMAERESLGTLVFAREYLVVPISDDSTIFPYEILMRSTAGMENINFVENVDSFPIKMQRIVIGCDFARSGNVGADYTVFSVWGIDAMHNYYLLHIFRKKGLSHNEQLSRIMTLDRMFKPSVIVFENNGFQSILADLARENGMKNIKEFTTTSSNKKNLRDGLPSLAALFERGVIRIPYSKVFDTKDKVDALFGEFNSIAFRSDKDSLESVSGHDDMVMSSFFAITELRNNMVEFRVDWV